ncbi:hypothetical protein P154DRAFT_574740 [Amniculicola lignicola CBS 123094]|uniref:Uncharacterized protein n=1 Tax=Amniculicola lignicola CBS 123094 TaxID=1392246 RepID=A0A6A5WL82_9PLEO|nr:hypothetical protein P154DRAFT_574740 [Amniculicola lignicola CBS 123094]
MDQGSQRHQKGPSLSSPARWTAPKQPDCRCWAAIPARVQHLACAPSQAVAVCSAAHGNVRAMLAARWASPEKKRATKSSNDRLCPATGFTSQAGGGLRHSISPGSRPTATLWRALSSNHGFHALELLESLPNCLASGARTNRPTRELLQLTASYHETVQ